jgi:hypothetical protein
MQKTKHKLNGAVTRPETYLHYRVKLVRDKETNQVTALVPALGIGDCGKDAQQALRRVQKMIAFHLDCLVEEGSKVPPESSMDEGLYLRVKAPGRAA